MLTQHANGSLGQASPSGVNMTPEQTRRSVQWLADKLVSHLPTEFVGDDDWGDTKSIWAGVQLRRDGWKLSTKRRKRELNHGRWVRYTIGLPDAARNSLNVQDANAKPRLPDVPIVINSVQAAVDPSGTATGWRVDASLATTANFDVRVERWNLGVQWYSIHLTGRMNLQLHTQAVMALVADYSEIPPAMQLDVHVQQASLAMSGLQVDRISKVGGDVAEELGEIAEDTIGKLWLRKENQRLASRLNSAVARNQDDLRWSMTQWFTQLGQ